MLRRRLCVVLLAAFAAPCGAVHLPTVHKSIKPCQKTKSFRSSSFLQLLRNCQGLSRSQRMQAYAGETLVACVRLRTLPQTAKAPYGRRSANGCSGRKRPRGKNYFAFGFWNEIIIQAFPMGTLRPCKRGRSLSSSHIKFSAFHYGTPCCM